jgi:hypothetical protein
MDQIVFKQFLKDKNIDSLSLPSRTFKMMTDIDTDVSKKDIKTVGGFLRNLSQQNQSGGGVSMPSEFFGNDSGSYFNDVSNVNYSDATPLLTRISIPSTFQQGGLSSKQYKFFSVSQMKKFGKNFNKRSTQVINNVLTKIFSTSLVTKSNGKTSINSKKLKATMNNFK